jgi:phosphoserine aminotransferase
LDSLAWAEEIGGLEALIARSDGNLRVVADWVDGSDWAAFLAADPAMRSSTSICLKIVDPWFLEQAPEARAAVTKEMARRLAELEVAYDIGSYRAAPPGLRIWGGATVEEQDITALLPWLDWSYQTVKAAEN